MAVRPRRTTGGQTRCRRGTWGWRSAEAVHPIDHDDSVAIGLNRVQLIDALVPNSKRKPSKLSNELDRRLPGVDENDRKLTRCCVEWLRGRCARHRSEEVGDRC